MFKFFENLYNVLFMGFDKMLDVFEFTADSME